MKQFLCKNRRLRERLIKTKEQIVETIQLLSAAALQQINEKRKEKKNEKMINVDEKSTKNVKIKKIVEKRFSKKKGNFYTMMSEVVGVKNSNTRVLVKYYIDDTTSTSSIFTKFSFEFENFLKKENTAQTSTQKKKQKKKKFEE